MFLRRTLSHKDPARQPRGRYFNRPNPDGILQAPVTSLTQKRERVAVLLLLLGALAHAPVLHAQPHTLLNFRPQFADYSNSLDRIIMVSSGPNLLHIFNPATQSGTTVSLPAAPNGISISPDGRFAAVGHNNLISYVNLATATLEKTLLVALNVTSLVLSAEYVYILPRMSVRIADGSITNPLASGQQVFPGRLNAAEGAIYSPEYGQIFRRPVLGANIETQSAATLGPADGVSSTPNDTCLSTELLLLPDRVYDQCSRAFETGGILRYSTSLPRTSPDAPLTALVAMAGHPTRGLAAIPVTAPYINFPVSDNEIYFYTRAFPSVLQGRFGIPDFVAGGTAYPAHGRWLFFDAAGSRLYAIIQADSAAGLTNDHAIYAVNLADPASCGVTLGSAQLDSPGAGSILSATVTSTTYGCAWQATTTAPWIALPKPYGAGTAAALPLLVRPNQTGAARTGTIRIGAETLTVNQPAAAASSTALTLQPLSFAVRQADYSKARDRLLLTSAYPHELHILDPATLADTTVALPFAPLSLTVSPDGGTAGVGGDGAVVLVNLSTGVASAPLRARSIVNSLVVPGDGYAYLFPPVNGVMTTLHLTTGVTRTSEQQTARGPARLQPPANRYIYAGEGRPASKWDTAAGTPGLPQLLSTATLTGVCGGLWLADDGARLVGRCAGVYRTTDSSSTDLAETGELAELLPTRVTWFATSTPARTAVVIPGSYGGYSQGPNDAELHFYGDNPLNYLGKSALPLFTFNGESYRGLGRSAFWNAAADKLVVVMQADASANVAADAALYTLGAGASCAAPAAGAASAAYTLEGGAGQIAVTASCPWRAVSNAGWLTITAGAFGAGSATLQYSVARNDLGSARTGIISFGNQIFTVTQSTGSLTLTPPSAAIGAAGGTASITVETAPATVNWTAAANATWLRINAGASGTGNGAVNYVVSPNPNTASRTGTITVGGSVFTVTQGAAPRDTVRADPTLFQTDAAGGSANIAITGNGTWIAASNHAWIRITAPSNGVGSGNGTLSIMVDPNPDAAPRTGSLTLNGIRIEVYQTELPATLTLTPPSLSLSAAGAAGTIRVSSSSLNYSWTAISSAAWLNVSGSGTQSGNITYTAAPNVSAEARTATILILPSSVTMTVTQAGAALPIPPLTAGLYFVPVTPCRIADTRENLGAFGKPALAAGTARSFSIQQAPCGVPAGARAYSMNVTVVPKGPLGYITIWPTGQAQPFVSTLNSADGRVKANAAIVPAGAAGAVSVVATDATELVLDINGYFIDANLNPTALAFYPIRPCRIADTREANGALGGPRLGTGATRSFPVLNAGCGIPSTARAYSMNATVVPAGPLGYISMWPTGQGQPLVSTLNAPTGAVVANAAIVPAGSSGEVSVFAQGETNLVLDVNGYFAPPGSADAQKFYPVTPCRLLDTRESAGSLGGPVLAAGAARSYPLPAANCGLPATARAFSLNATAVPETILGYLTMWPAGQAQPFVSTLNATDDRIVANAAIVSAGASGAVSTFVTNKTHLVLDTNGYFAQ